MKKYIYGLMAATFLMGLACSPFLIFFTGTDLRVAASVRGMVVVAVGCVISYLFLAIAQPIKYRAGERPWAMILQSFPTGWLAGTAIMVLRGIILNWILL